MNSDIRIAVDFLDHPKTIELIARHGHEAALGLLRLWLWTATHRPTGSLSGLSDASVSSILGLGVEVVQTLAEIRWLDGKESERTVHDWAEHNGYASAAKRRQTQARINALVRWDPEAAAIMRAHMPAFQPRQMPDNMPQDMRYDHAPSPAPAPIAGAEETRARDALRASAPRSTKPRTRKTQASNSSSNEEVAEIEDSYPRPIENRLLTPDELRAEFYAGGITAEQLNRALKLLEDHPKETHVEGAP